MPNSREVSKAASTRGRNSRLRSGVATIKDFQDQTARQIEREEALINNRLSWTLTFQGLLFAGLAIVVDGTCDQSVRSLVSGVPIVGGAIALLAFIGIHAAYLSIDQFKREWRNDSRTSHEVAPYGPKCASVLGRITGYGIPVTIALAWAWVWCRLQG